MKYTGDDGVEIDVFTTAELEARVAETRTAVENEYKPKLEEVTTKLTAADQAAAARAAEFGQFRKLSEDQVKQLSEKDAIIYNNTKLLVEAQEREQASAKTAKENAVDASIRAKVGTNDSLFAKVKSMYGVMGLEDLTQEQINTKVSAALGALGQTEPDLLKAAGLSFNGSFEPPKAAVKENESFADTERGKQMADALGLMTEPPAKK